MKTLNTIFTVIFLQLLGWYGWTFSVSDGWIIQGYIGAASPVVFGAMLFGFGRASVVQS